MEVVIGVSDRGDPILMYSSPRELKNSNVAAFGECSHTGAFVNVPAP